MQVDKKTLKYPNIIQIKDQTTRETTTW